MTDFKGKIRAKETAKNGHLLLNCSLYETIILKN